MSSHIRYFMRCGAGTFAGARVKKYLTVNTGVPVKTVAEVAAAAKNLGVRLWILREPRKLHRGQSRYKRVCAYYGVGKFIKKRKPVFIHEIPPAEGQLLQHVEYGFADQVGGQGQGIAGPVPF